VSIDGLVIGDN